MARNKIRDSIHDWKDRLWNHSKVSSYEVQDPTGSIQPQDDSVARPESTTASESSESKPKTEPTEKRKSLWEAAYNLLDETERQVLSTVQISENPKTSDAPHDTREILNKVIDLTKEQYNEYKNGGWKIPISGQGHINVREISENIITKALSFKDIITSIAALDPTQHASAAWSIAGCGLTLMSNHYESKHALFKSSDDLADAIFRNTMIELHFYQNADKATPEIEKSITRVYKAILRYTVEVQRARNPSNKRKVLDCITAMTSQSLTDLLLSIQQEEKYLKDGVDMDQHLQRKEEACSILNKLDEALLDLRSLLDNSILRELNALEDARFDAYQNPHSDQGIDDDPLMGDYDGKCKEGTRAEFLEHVMSWAQSPDEKPIFWLNGMAGFGKTTISRTLAAKFQDEGILGASFFFRRGEGDRGIARHLFATIAKQLAERIPRMIPAIKEAVLTGIPKRTIQTQFKSLLEEPLSTLYPPGHQMQPMVIVIDALDECESLTEREEVLRLLPKAAQIQSVPLRFFLTSRPELPKAHDFESSRNEFVLHEVSGDIIRRDLSNFLKDQFRIINEKRNDEKRTQDLQADLDPPDWPGQEAIQKLVDLSVPLFIYAATVCRFMRQPDHLADELLERLLGNSASGSGMGLDQMYLTILEQPIRRMSKEMKAVYMKEFHGIIGVIVVLAAPLSVNALASVTKFGAEKVEKRVSTLRSVLSYSGERQVPVRPLHLSFRDFLLRTESDFLVKEEEVHTQLASSCLRIMKSLKRNICGLPTTGTERAVVETNAIGKRIPPELQYACRFWAHHVENCLDPQAFEQEVLSFLETHALHWLEAMSLLGILRESIGILNTLISVFQNDKASKLEELLIDCKRLITRNMEGVDMAPLQLYSSALIFAPQNSGIRKLFQHEIPTTISRLPTVDLEWGPLLHTLDDCEDHFVEFSPDGRYLATSARDKVNLWDTITWELRRTLECSSYVRCVAISSQSEYFATGLEDHSVSVWDTVKWEEKHRHIYDEPVESIAFSRENTLAMLFRSCVRASDISFTKEYLAASIDAASIGARVRFSPRDRLLIANCEEVIKVWETTKWGFDRDLPYGAEEIRFSPAGDLLSIFYMGTATILETEGWKVLHEVDTHSSNGFSLSRDGSLLAAGNIDGSISIIGVGDPASRTLLKGHSQPTRRLSFSPTMDTLASTASDNTVKLWSTPTDILSYFPADTPHRQFVTRVVFSPGGEYVVSYAWGGDLAIWDAKEGNIKFRWNTNHNSQWWMRQILEFSPDDQWLVNWAYGDRLRIWNTTTQELVLEDEKVLGGDSNDISFDEKGILVTSSQGDKTRLTQFPSRLRPEHEQECGAHLKVEESWIVEAASGERIIWLPHEYRPEIWEGNDHFASSCDVHERTVVWGTGSGNVYFMEVGQGSHLQTETRVKRLPDEDF